MPQARRNVASGIAKIVSTLAALDGAFAKANSAFDQGTGTTTRQLSTLVKLQDELSALQKQLVGASAAQERFNKFIGPPTAQMQQRCCRRRRDQTFAGAATSAIDRFARAVAEGENVFASVKNTFLSFAADFLRQIAQMILQQLLFNPISGALSGLGGGPSGTSGGMDLRSFKLHSGGIATQGQNVSVMPSWSGNALRYHTGGIAGLAPDEVPAILQRNEEVLTENDPRHRFNGGAGVEPVVNNKIVNIIDSVDMLRQALSSAKGERITLNHVRSNSTAWKDGLG